MGVIGFVGLNRCRKSCRLRWLNYLSPSIKRGRFSSDEVDLLLRLHKLLGNRWSLIAGRLPHRTANDIKNYWNTHLSKNKHTACSSTEPNTKNTKKHTACSSTEPNQKVEVIKPLPRSLANWKKVDYPGLRINDCVHQDNNNNVCEERITCNNDDELVKNEMITDRESMWWESLLDESEEANKVVSQEPESSLMASTCPTFDVDQLWNLLNEDSEELD